MKFDVAGRISNMRLPDGKTALLYSIYEAVSNAIQAIEERFGRAEFTARGVIKVLVEINEDKTLKHLAISDNGIGLNSTHLRSFETCDTREKQALGGKGVGRLIWTTVFNDIRVKSTFETGLHDHTQIKFQFVPTNDNSLVDMKTQKGNFSEVGTQIILAGINADQNAGLSRPILTRHLCHHFFPYFIAGSMPTLRVEFAHRNIDIVDFLSSKVQKAKEEEVEVDCETVGNLNLTHVYVEKSISQELSNTILLTAQGRVVKSIEIGKKFALKSLENGKAYVCVVNSDFLDTKVDQERMGFKALDYEMEAIIDAAIAAAENFLDDHIASIRRVQKTLVIEILEEHPQLAISVKDVDKYVNSLSPSMSSEDIGKTLFTLLYRHEKKLKRKINELSKSDININNSDEQINLLVQQVSDDAKRRLAEYTIKRHQIIQIARSLLKFNDEEKKTYHWEKTLHELICPMGKMLEAKDYDEHNLWLLDDLLSYYSLFASDKSMSSLGIAGERKEPDLIFFNPYGFRREDTNDPVVIVEFKRPGDETLSSDPVDQVLDYIERLRSKTVKDIEGEIVSDINDNTPFECIVICDLSASARKKFERSVAQHPTPDGLGYYGFSQNHKASIRVLSYKKVFRDAELRNRSFFSRLGLLPTEVQKSLQKLSEAAE